MSTSVPDLQTHSNPTGNPCVLLLGNDDRVLLAVARGLGRQGIDVHIAWCDDGSEVLTSRYVSEFHSLPSYTPQSDDWLVALNDLVNSRDFELVIPCNDFAVIPLQNHRAKLDDRVRWYLINDEAFRVAFDKGETSRLAKSLGIKTPEEYSLTASQIRQYVSEGDGSEIDGQPLRFPVYLKPRTSVTQNDVSNKRSAEKIDSAECLVRGLEQNSFTDGVLIQQSFNGVGIGVEVLASDGEILLQLQHRRIRETIDGGSTYRESIDEIPELTEAAGKLVASLNYTGVAMFEFRYCVETGDWVFLEINARFWGSLPLAIASGANFPHALYELLVNDRQQFESGYQTGRRCRDLVKDLRAFRKQKNSKFEFWNLLLGRDCLDFFALDDWRPQWVNLSKFVGSFVGKLARIPQRAS